MASAWRTGPPLAMHCTVLGTLGVVPPGSGDPQPGKWVARLVFLWVSL